MKDPGGDGNIQRKKIEVIHLQEKQPKYSEIKVIHLQETHHTADGKQGITYML